jgi:putative flavoprotein involved in K+ transport
MSEHLTQGGVAHMVLERGRIAERWRSERWDSLVANGPAWHDRFPNMTFTGQARDSFVPKEQVADYFVDYARMIGSDIRCGVEVRKVTRLEGRSGFSVETSQGVVEAGAVVAATGAFQRPLIPQIVPQSAPFLQIHSTAYRNPAQLPEGAVLVVGCGSSGAQIADELCRSGRRVILSVGPHDRTPRAYRGRDFCWWLGVMNKWDAESTPGKEHVTIAISGADGGKTVDFRKFAAQGMVLVGRAQDYTDGTLRFSTDLAANLERGDAYYLALLREADAYAARHGLDFPPEPEAHVIAPDPDCLSTPIAVLDLAKEGVTTIIWATGFATDFSWLPPDAVDAQGRPAHLRGVSAEPGVYFLGLPWQTRRASSFIWGVWYDAKYVVDHIAKQRAYRAYSPAI